jgi:flagellin
MWEIGDKTKFNGNDLLKGATKSFQVGANEGETISTTAVDVRGATSGKGIYDILDVVYVVPMGTPPVADPLNAKTNFDNLDIAKIDTAVANVSAFRSDLGAVQNRLEHRLSNLSTYQENLVASESRIRDVDMDMASEMVNFTKLQILQQAGTSMLAQANQAPQGVLLLLR